MTGGSPRSLSSVIHCEVAAADRIWRRAVTDGRAATACLTVSGQPSYGGRGPLPTSTRVGRSWSAVKYARNNAVHLTRLRLPAGALNCYTVHFRNWRDDKPLYLQKKQSLHSICIIIHKFIYFNLQFYNLQLFTILQFTILQFTIYNQFIYFNLHSVYILSAEYLQFHKSDRLQISLYKYCLINYLYLVEIVVIHWT